MGNEKKPKNKLILPIVCALTCLIIIVVVACFALFGKDESNPSPTSGSETPTTETTEKAGGQLPSMPLADESSDRDNIGYDIFK